METTGQMSEDLWPEAFSDVLGDLAEASDGPHGVDVSWAWIGLSCSAGSDCPSHLCVAYADHAICTVDCLETANCPLGWICVRGQMDDAYCLPEP